MHLCVNRVGRVTLRSQNTCTDCMPCRRPAQNFEMPLNTPRFEAQQTRLGALPNLSEFIAALKSSVLNLNARAARPGRVRKARKIINLGQRPAKNPARCLWRAVDATGGARLAKMVVPECAVHGGTIAGKKGYKWHARDVPTCCG